MNLRIRQRWTFFGFIILAGLIFCYVTRSEKKEVRKNKEKDSPSYAVQFNNVCYSYEEPRKNIRWELRAKKIEFSKDRNTVFFYDFHLCFYSNKKKDLELRGKKGRYLKKERVIYFKGPVDLVYKGYRLLTEDLVFYEEKGKGVSDSYVKISGPFFVIKGKGLFLDIKNKKIKVISDVESSVKKVS